MTTLSTRTHIGALAVTMLSDREVSLACDFDAPRQRLFDAWTRPEHVARWMLGPEGWTMPVCEIDLRVGGSWHFVWRKTDGTEMSMRGTYKEIAPPDRLVSTESWGPQWPETINTLALAESDGKTTVTETILYPSKEARDAALATGMAQGVALSFERLAEHLRCISAAA